MPKSWIKPNTAKILIAVFVLAASAFFLFFRLGHYALWDDEADTALFAQSLWRTGDTFAMLDHNLIAHTDGKELKDLRNRYLPPLQFYIAAPFTGLAPGSALAARLPFAVCGFLSIVFVLFWLWRGREPVAMWLLMSGGILGNVSFMLYSRQCRYFAPAILLTVISAFLYVNRDGRKRTAAALAVSLFLLFASNYMSYAAALACMLADYLVWGRKIRPFSYGQIIIFAGLQVLLGGLLTRVYNPLGMSVWENTSGNWLIGKATLFLWNLRELNSCELGVGVLIFMAPFLYRVTGDRRLLRGTMAIIIYVLTVSLCSPQPVSLLSVAFIRYLAPLIPLCIFVAVLSIQTLTLRFKWLVVPLALMVFGTNILHGGPLSGVDKKTHFSAVIAKGRFRSTILDYVRELIAPPPSAYRAVSDWINQNIREKESVVVLPTYSTYPLMFHAPKAIYVWQLKEKSGQFSELPDIHFRGKIPPEYVIAFGPFIDQARQAFTELEARGVHYRQLRRIDRYWYDLTRPELFWHSFREVKEFSRDNEAIYIFKKV